MAVTRLNVKTYSDVAYVEGIFRRDPMMERALHYHCKRYFDENYKSVFFVGNEHKYEIFQEAFITLWEKIMNKKIYVEDGELKGKDGDAFSGKLTTFFMSIARLKYLEWARENLHRYTDEEEERRRREQEMELFKSLLYDSDDETMLEIIADCISKMSKQCNQILTMFYYEEKTLDDIMVELRTFESKNALKTRKYKCMEELRKSAKSIYRRYLNSYN